MSPSTLPLRRRTVSSWNLCYLEKSGSLCQFVNFDGPDRSACHKRSRTNTPLQALTLLNDQAYVEMALASAVSILEKTQKSDQDRITHAVRRALSRDPSGREAKYCLVF